MNLISSTRWNLLSATAVVATLVSVPPASAQNFHIGTAAGTKLTTCPSDPLGVSGSCWGLNIS